MLYSSRDNSLFEGLAEKESIIADSFGFIGDFQLLHIKCRRTADKSFHVFRVEQTID